jgi:hypothetical protein
MRRVFLTAALAAALAVGGCTHVQITSHTSTTVIQRNATEKVVHTCVENIFENGLLPLGPAQQECMQCVVQALDQLGFKTSGISATELIEEIHLSAKQASSLNTACNQDDVDD